MKFCRLINGTAIIINNMVDVQWHKLGFTSQIQRNVFENQLINFITILYEH